MKRIFGYFLIPAIPTAAVLAILGVVGHQAVEHMDSPQFCGTTCHTVMQPEWTSYNGSKHSRVACVQCHIGPGATWMVKSKINGLRQVWNVLAGSYSRPVSSPVVHLRPSRDTCEQCHWPEKFTGNKLLVFPHFKEDKDNTPAYDVMLLRVGGRSEKSGRYEGIHWHVSDNHQVRYEELDPKRTKVGKISVFENGKLVATYLPPEKDRNLPVLSERTMDCLDCHNRPTHVFDYSPALAVDRAMGAGMLDQKVPFLAKVSADALSHIDIPRPDAESRLRQVMEADYQQSYPDAKPSAQVLDDSAKTLAALYRRNIFPEMHIGWGTYRSHLGHKQEGDKSTEVFGCFRCHDDAHEKTMPDGTKVTLSQGCEKCHEPLAVGENPAELPDELQQLLPR